MVTQSPWALRLTVKATQGLPSPPPRGTIEPRTFKLRLASKELGDERIGARGELGLETLVNRKCLGTRVPSSRDVKDDVVTHRYFDVLARDERVRGELRVVEPQDSARAPPVGGVCAELDETVSRRVLTAVRAHGSTWERRSDRTDGDGLRIGI